MLLPLLAAKLAVPPAPIHIIPRQRLMERLNDGLARKLSLISAPAGFGKTTLLSQWISTYAGEQGSRGDFSPAPLLPCSPAQFAWVSLDRRDNDPHRFWRYFLAALSSQKTGNNGFSQVDLPEALTEDELVARVESALVEMSEEIVLVLDDYHLITAQTVHDMLAFVVSNLPAQIHLYIATRVDPPLPLSQLRVRGQMAELRAGDLRFTISESMAFLNQAMGLAITAEELAALDARTEGWAAGLQLAALSLREREDPNSFIQSFTGTHRLVEDYLTEQVLDQQPEAIRSFLLETSVLERLCGPLCDAVLGDEGRRGIGEYGNDRSLPLSPYPLFPCPLSPSQQILEYLEHSNLFLIPLDDNRRWYRYHPLFARFLQERLRQGSPDLWLALNGKASEWCQKVGLVEDAVQYALEAKDFHQAACLIEEAADKLFSRNEVFTMLDWMKILPEELVAARPRLCITFAWALALSGQRNLVEPYLLKAEALLPEPESIQALSGTENVEHDGNGANGRKNKQPISSEIANIRSYLARFRGDLSKAILYSRRALEQAVPDHANERGIGLVLLGRAQYLEGDLEAANRSLLEASRLSRFAGPATAYLSAVHYLAQLRVVQGQLRQAAAIYQEAIQYVDEQDEPVLAGIERVGMGGLLVEWNELEKASSVIHEGLQLAEAGGDYGFLRDAYLAKARLEQAKGRPQEALAAIERVCQLSRRNQRESIDLSWVEAQRARLLLSQGDLDGAVQWAQSTGLDLDVDLPFVQEYSSLTLARVFLARGEYDRAGRLLDRLAQLARSCGRNGRLIEALLLQALVHQAIQDLPQAHLSLQAALALARPEGYLRTFLDEGSPLAILLQECFKTFSPPEPDLSAAGEGQKSRKFTERSKSGRLKGRKNGNGSVSHSEEKSYIEKLLAGFGTQAALDVHTPLSSSNPPPPAASLSERELQVLRLMAEGKTYQEISQQLLVTISTIQTHVKHAYFKLEAHSGLEATARARQLNLIP